MHRELPLYIFIRNSIILCFAFLLVTSVIIERRKQLRGENSVLNKLIKRNIDSYTNLNPANLEKFNPVNEYSNFSIAIDSIPETSDNQSFSNTLVNKKYQAFLASSKEDL